MLNTAKPRILKTIFANRDNLLACDLLVLRHITRATAIIEDNSELAGSRRH